LSTEEEIEQLARFLCEYDGNEPDVLITNYEPFRLKGRLSGYRSVSYDTACAKPAWQAYATTAVAALNWKKSNA
jgi:hypothetical protein